MTPFQLTSGRYPRRWRDRHGIWRPGLQNFTIGDTVTVDTGQRHSEFARRRAGAHARIESRRLRNARGLHVRRRPSTDHALAFRLAGHPVSHPVSGLVLSPEIAVTVQNQNDANTVAMTLQQVLLAHGITVYGYNIRRVGIPLHRQNAIAGVFSLLRILAIVAVVMSALPHSQHRDHLVAEQTAIIGTMKAAGGTRGAIMRGYLVSVGIYSAAWRHLPAIVLGLLCGYGLGSSLASSALARYRSLYRGSAGSSSLAWLSASACRCFAALLPLWNGTRISVREALSAYGVSAGSGNGIDGAAG